jgi:phosphoketolase
LGHDDHGCTLKLDVPDNAPATDTVAPLTPEELTRLDAYWRAANYLSVGQIYLLDNPLLREPLRIEHTKPRLLGHCPTFASTPSRSRTLE